MPGPEDYLNNIINLGNQANRTIDTLKSKMATAGTFALGPGLILGGIASEAYGGKGTRAVTDTVKDWKVMEAQANIVSRSVQMANKAFIDSSSRVYSTIQKGVELFKDYAKMSTVADAAVLKLAGSTTTLGKALYSLSVTTKILTGPIGTVVTVGTLTYEVFNRMADAADKVDTKLKSVSETFKSISGSSGGFIGRSASRYGGGSQLEFLSMMQRAGDFGIRERQATQLADIASLIAAGRGESARELHAKMLPNVWARQGTMTSEAFRRYMVEQRAMAGNIGPNWPSFGAAISQAQYNIGRPLLNIRNIAGNLRENFQLSQESPYSPYYNEGIVSSLYRGVTGGISRLGGGIVGGIASPLVAGSEYANKLANWGQDVSGRLQVRYGRAGQENITNSEREQGIKFSPDIKDFYTSKIYQGLRNIGSAGIGRTGFDISDVDKKISDFEKQSEVIELKMSLLEKVGSDKNLNDLTEKAVIHTQNMSKLRKEGKLDESKKAREELEKINEKIGPVQEEFHKYIAILSENKDIRSEMTSLGEDKEKLSKKKIDIDNSIKKQQEVRDEYQKQLEAQQKMMGIKPKQGLEVAVEAPLKLHEEYVHKTQERLIDINEELDKLENIRKSGEIREGDYKKKVSKLIAEQKTKRAEIQGIAPEYIDEYEAAVEAKDEKKIKDILTKSAGRSQFVTSQYKIDVAQSKFAASIRPRVIETERGSLQFQREELARFGATLEQLKEIDEKLKGGSTELRQGQELAEIIYRTIKLPIERVSRELESKYGIRIGGVQREIAQRQGIPLGIESGYLTSSIEPVREVANRILEIRKTVMEKEIDFTKTYTEARMSIVKEHYDHAISMEKLKLEARDKQLAPQMAFGQEFFSVGQQRLGIQRGRYTGEDYWRSQYRGKRGLQWSRENLLLQIGGVQMPEQVQQMRALRQQTEAEQDFRREQMRQMREDRMQIANYRQSMSMIGRVGVGTRELMGTESGRNLWQSMLQQSQGAFGRQGIDVAPQMYAIVQRQQEEAARRLQMQLRTRGMETRSYEEQIGIMEGGVGEAYGKGKEIGDRAQMDLAGKYKEAAKYFESIGDTARYQETMTKYQDVIGKLPDRLKTIFDDQMKIANIELQKHTELLRKIAGVGDKIKIGEIGSNISNIETSEGEKERRLSKLSSTGQEITQVQRDYRVGKITRKEYQNKLGTIEANRPENKISMSTVAPGSSIGPGTFSTVPSIYTGPGVGSAESKRMEEEERRLEANLEVNTRQMWAGFGEKSKSTSEYYNDPRVDKYLKNLETRKKLLGYGGAGGGDVGRKMPSMANWLEQVRYEREMEESGFAKSRSASGKEGWMPPIMGNERNLVWANTGKSQMKWANSGVTSSPDSQVQTSASFVGKFGQNVDKFGAAIDKLASTTFIVNVNGPGTASVSQSGVGSYGPPG